MNERPVLYRLIEANLAEPLADFVAARRPYWSWRQLAAEITKTTGVAVSHEGLRTWFAAAGPSTDEATALTSTPERAA